MGITASNLSFGEVNRRFYGRKFRFTATRRGKSAVLRSEISFYGDADASP